MYLKIKHFFIIFVSYEGYVMNQYYSTISFYPKFFLSDKFGYKIFMKASAFFFEYTFQEEKTFTKKYITAPREFT